MDINKQPELKMSYSWTDYALYEREQFDEMEKLLRRGRMTEEDRKTVSGLRDWHFQNCMAAVRERGVPMCVKDYVLGSRDKPSWREIQHEYAERREYFRQKAVKRERLYYKIVFSLTFLAVLFVIFKLR